MTKEKLKEAFLQMLKSYTWERGDGFKVLRGNLRTIERDIDRIVDNVYDHDPQQPQDNEMLYYQANILQDSVRKALVMMEVMQQKIDQSDRKDYLTIRKE